MLPALLDAAPDRRIIALGPEPQIAAALPERENLEILHTAPRRNLLWQFTTLPGLLRQARADVFLSVWNLVCTWRYAGRQLAWLHDLIPFRATRYGFRSTYRWKTQFNLWVTRRKATDLVVVSHFTREDTIRTLGLAPERVQVVHPGIEGSVFRPPAPEAVAAARERYGLPERFLMAVGGGEPRKNLGLLIESWQAVRPEVREGVVLALAGGAFRGRGVLDEVPESARQGIVALGRVPDEDLPVLYGGAALFLYPSLAEGFGMPPLEAMGCGTPVIASDSTSIPEATGDAALLVSPEPAAFALQIERVLTDEALATDLVRRGSEQVARYTWAIAAEKVLGLLDQPVARPGL